MAETNIREQMARAMCAVDGVDPDQRAVGMGVIMAQGQEYKLWEARLRMVDACLDVLAVVDHKLLDFAREGLPLDSGTAARFWITAVNTIKAGAA